MKNKRESYSREKDYSKNDKRYGDGGGGRRVWKRPTHFLGTSSLDWNRKKQNKYPYHRYHNTKSDRYNWRSQQEYQKQQALQALKILNSFNQGEESSQYRNEPLPRNNIFDKDHPSTSNHNQSIQSEEKSKVSDEKTSNQNKNSSHVDPGQSTNEKQNEKTNSVDVNVVENNTSNLIEQTNENVKIKTEEDLNTTNCNDTPKVDHMYKSDHEIQLSLIPLSLLLKEEPTDLVLEKHFEELKKQFETSSSEKEKQPETAEPSQSSPPNQDPETLSRKLVNRVTTMDRDSIKNVINNPGSKFDAALKLRARKRLREEIRRQLRQLNLGATSEGNDSNAFEPDDFVDSAQIPEAVINEIRKTFGLQFLEEAGITTNDSLGAEAQGIEALSDIVEDTVQKTSNEKEENQTGKPKTDLMTRLKNLESIKSNRSKLSDKPPVDNEVIIKATNTEEIVAINSSSDSSDNSDSSDSDSNSSSSSSTSECSSYSAQKTLKEKRALEENVVSSFKTLILPQLTSQQRRCFEKKSTNGTLESLTYIYDICLNKMSKELAVGNYQKRILKKNLKSSNNEEALQFLIKNIKELFEQGKMNRRKKADCQKKAIEAKKQSAKTLHGHKNKSPQKLSEENQQIPFNAANEIPGLKPSNDNHPPYRDTGAHPQEYITKEKVPTENKTAQSAVGGANNQPLSVEGNKAGRTAFESDCNKTSGEALMCLDTFSPQSSSNKNSVNRSESECLDSTNVGILSPGFLSSSRCDTVHTIESSGPESTDNDHRPRSWKSPGEKKCLEPLSSNANTPTLEVASEPTFDYLSNESQSNILSDVNTMNLSSTFNINQAENLRVLALIQQNKISEAVLNNLKEIDLKLMELHKRKMYVEEMILKLQKDKMAIDLNTMQLQNEKFFIISTAAAQSSLTMNSAASFFPQTVKSELFERTNVKSNTKNKKKKGNGFKPPFSTPFSEKLRNRKKRCQRDILLEDTANSFCNDNIALTDLIRHSSPDEISENVDDIFQRKKRKIVKKSDVSTPTSTKQNKRCPSTSQKDRSNKEDNKEDHTFPAKSIHHVPSIVIEEPTSECSQEESVPEIEEENYSNDSFDTLNNSDLSNGSFDGFKLPISQIRVSGEFVFAASEDGHVYKFSCKTKKLLSKFTKHTEAVTQILIDSNEYVYTTSLDGYMKKTSVENFGLEIQSVNTQEPLQTIEQQWNTAFIGSRWGNVFTYNVKKNKLANTLLCSVGSSIMALKAAKEGARRILIVSSKGNQINLRDATSGLLLRTIEVPPNVNIYSILLNESLLYCGSSKNEIFTYDFTTGRRVSTTFVCGNGVVSMKIFRKKFIFAGCYDGFVYVLEKKTGCQIGRFPGCGKVILAMDIVGEKLLTSTKDNSMQLTDIPKYILALD